MNRSAAGCPPTVVSSSFRVPLSCDKPAAAACTLPIAASVRDVNSASAACSASVYESAPSSGYVAASAYAQ